MSEIILLFNFRDRDRKKRLMRTLLPLRIRVKEIPKEDYGKVLGHLAGIKDFLPEGEESFLKAEQASMEELSGEMLVMAGVSEKRIDQILKAIHKSGLQIPYKAVLTSVNQNWNVWELFREIKKEHETMVERKRLS